VFINCTKKSVKLTTPDGKKLEFVTESVVTTKGVANHAKVNQMEDIQGSEVPVVNEFLMSSLRRCRVFHLTKTSSL
jgi:hypothetical protein